MPDIAASPEQSRDIRAIQYFLAAVALAAVVLAWIWYAQRVPAPQGMGPSNQPAGVGLVLGNTGGGSGF